MGDLQRYWWPRFISIMPVFGLWYDDKISFFWVPIWSMVIITITAYWDLGRSPVRTSIVTIYARIYVTFFLMGILSCTLLFGALLGDLSTFPISTMAWVVCLPMWKLMGIVWFFVAVLNGVGKRTDPDHAWALANGAHPFWDMGIVGDWFNPDPQVVRINNLREPVYKGYVPPPEAQAQCPKCGARNFPGPRVCWNCGYGLDGDSTAYYERWGKAIEARNRAMGIHPVPPPPPPLNGPPRNPPTAPPPVPPPVQHMPKRPRR